MALQTHTITVVLDDEDPLEKKRSDARSAARTFYDQITGDGQRRLAGLKEAVMLPEGGLRDSYMRDVNAARLCPKE